MGVATAVAVGVGAASAAASFAAAAKQNKLRKEAMQDAEKAMQEAKDKLNVNYYDVLGIQKEPYELQREAALAQGAQTIEAAKEADRGAAATAGRLQMAQNQMQAGIRSDMSKEMQTLDKLKAAEDARLQSQKASLDLAEVQGAQQAQADAAKAAAAYTTQGIQSLGQAASSLAGGLSKPYGKVQDQTGGGSGDQPTIQTVGTENQPIVTQPIAPGTENLGSFDVTNPWAIPFTPPK